MHAVPFPLLCDRSLFASTTERDACGRSRDSHRARKRRVCLPPPYGRRTSGVRVLWVVVSSSALHTDHMSGHRNHVRRGRTRA